MKWCFEACFQMKWPQKMIEWEGRVAGGGFQEGGVLYIGILIVWFMTINSPKMSENGGQLVENMRYFDDLSPN